MKEAVDVAVVGAGVVGLGIAWQLVRSGRGVCVVDPDPAGGATRAAAGMLAPASEFRRSQPQVLALARASADLYPGLIRTLEDLGHTTGYAPTGTLVVGVDAADREVLREDHEARIARGLRSEAVSVRRARGFEPLLSPGISGAWSLPDDHSVDPRRLSAALIAALTSGASCPAARWERRPAVGLLHAQAGDPSSRVVGIRLADGDTLLADDVVIANGLAARELGPLPRDLVLPVRAVHGDILRMGVPRPLRPLLHSTVRGLVRGSPVYVVPRDDDSVVVGATEREDGAPGVSTGGVAELLRDAIEILPALRETELIEVMARARPCTPDDGPLLGRIRRQDGEALPGLIIATGFSRHGVLLTPVAADICRRLVDGVEDPRWLPFRPDRFTTPPLTATEVS